jgi:hypothetical protein
VKKGRISSKDVFVLSSVYVALLSLVLILPENNSVISGCILAAYALASFVVVDRIK